MSILAIPGFLGLPSDWNMLNLQGVNGVDLHALDWTSLADWGKKFNAFVRQQQDAPAILMGYSLGGRLALHALIDQPTRWKGAIIISAHPGLADPGEKERRLEHDRQWAARFEKEEWGSLMRAWNGQAVFSQDAFHFDRRESDYQRMHLTHTLWRGSLGSQGDLRKQIEGLEMPLLWLTGSKDRHYCSLAETLSFLHPASRWLKVEGAGHRVPWGQPESCRKIINKFINNICN